jgi:hypothetical protein
MGELRGLPGDVRALLALARRDRRRAAAAFSALPLDSQVALVCEAPAGRRADLLDLAEEPEALIPRLPEAELCFTVKAMGLASAIWLLEHATPEQVVACIDLDAWRGHAPVPSELDAWIDALAETSDDALAGSLAAIDPELVVCYLQDRLTAVMKPAASEDEGFEPPPGSKTLDGVFWFSARRDADDLAACERVLRLLFERDYWAYFRMLQGTIWEPPAENQEWALRWRSGRLEDLGFPPWEEAMGLYRYLAPQERDSVPADVAALEVGEWHLPVWIPNLPARADSPHLLFRALAELEPDERRAAFYAFASTVNELAVADRMPLSDAETTPRAIEKAAHWISRGLEHLAAVGGLPPAEVLRRTPLERLFRVGANLDPESARPPSEEESEDAESDGPEAAPG